MSASNIVSYPQMMATSSSSSSVEDRARSQQEAQQPCYVRAVDSTSDIERSLVEARTLLERRVEDGQLEVGDYTTKIRLQTHIGGGSFGEVYRGLGADGTPVAVKVEFSRCLCSSRSSLLHEGGVYRKLSGCVGIPNVIWYGMHGSDYSILVMDLLGPTLYSAWTRLGQQFTMKTLLMVVDQTLEVLSDVHSRGFVHRDISPSNFLLGPLKDRIYLVDFGQAKQLVNQVFPATRQRFSFTRPVVGTPRFASIFSHAGLEPSYRDDLESLGYMWIYLASSRLPWQGIRDFTGPAKIGRIGQLKMSISLEELCAGLPQEFGVFMAYARSLRQQEMPDYNSIRQMFRGLQDKLDLNMDNKFDWSDADMSRDADAYGYASRLNTLTSSTPLSFSS